MIHPSALWILLASIVPALTAFGWIRSRTIARAHHSMCAELTKAGVPLSDDDIDLLLGRLVWNPLAAVETESDAGLRAIKAEHVQALLKSLAVLRTCFWILELISAGVVFWLTSTWAIGK